MKMAKLLLLLTLSVFVLTGCWDKIEIEERGFVVGVAVDLPEKEEEIKEGKVMLTQQIVVPGALADSGSNLGGGGGGDAYLNTTTVGSSLSTMIRETSAETSRYPFYGHNRVIFISEDLARSPMFAKVFDHFIRFPEMRRGMKVMITKGKAKDILEIQPKNERLPALYINTISINNRRNSRMLPVSKIGEIHYHLLKNQSFTIQKIETKKDAVKIAGNAVFQGKTNTLVGFLEEEKTEGLNFLTGDVQGGFIEAKLNDIPIVFEIDKVEHSFSAQPESPTDISYTVDIDVKGNIVESFATSMSLKELGSEKVQNAVEERIKELSYLTATTLQEEFKTDIIGINKYLELNYYSFWQTVNENWDTGENYFSTVNITVNPTVEIIQNGTTIQTNDRG